MGKPFDRRRALLEIDVMGRNELAAMFLDLMAPEFNEQIAFRRRCLSAASAESRRSIISSEDLGQPRLPPQKKTFFDRLHYFGDRRSQGIML